MDTQLAIVGLGLIGLRHAVIIDGLSSVQLGAIVDPTQAARTEAQARGCAWFASLEDMFAKMRPDGVILATPTTLHVAHALICVTHGTPVLVEKPLCNTTSEALPLLQAAKAADVPILTGYHRRHNPLISRAKAAIDDGQLGMLRSVHTQCWFYKPDPYFDDTPWRKKSGAGPISVNLAHDIDLMRYLCGNVTEVRAVATPALRGYENEDLAAAILTFANGVVGTISVSDSIAAPWSWECTSGENPVYSKTDESCYRIGGSRASLSIPDMTLWQHKDAPDWWTPFTQETLEASDHDPLELQILHFADVIHRRSAPIITLADSIQTTQVIEAIQTACETGQAVKMSSLSDLS